MKRRDWVLVGLVFLCGVFAVVTAAAQDDVPVSSLKFVVVRDYNGKPVKNASVVLHPLNSKGKQARGGLQLKTDTDGHAGFDGVPYGQLRIQVLVAGFQTFGQDYDINKPEMEITIKLKRPQGQYSIYQDHPEDKKPEDKKEEKNDAQKAPDEKPPEQKPQ